MPFDVVNSVVVRPDRMGTFHETVAELAGKAAQKEESWRWTAHQTLFGDMLAIHFVSQAESLEAIGSRGTVEDLWRRVLGDQPGGEAFLRTNECIQAVQQTISVDRPDLSYAPDVSTPADYAYAVVTSARARPGHAEACEELIRKLAEAIPKVGDPARMMAYQVMFGELGAYWTVRPVHGLDELDHHLPTPELLDRAFPNGEGGLIWRTGTEAMEQARREILRYVPELSNPGD